MENNINQLSNFYPSFEKYGIDFYLRQEFIRLWCEPHRFYHNINHLLEILHLALSDFNSGSITQEEYDLLCTVALVHDVIYDPRKKDNEEQSAEFYKRKVGDTVPAEKVRRVYDMVMATKNHSAGSPDRLTMRFLKYDLNNLLSSNISIMIDVDEKIFKEYGFVDHKVYRESRYYILQQMRDFIKSIEPTSAIDSYLQYIKSKKRTIAIFPGSFNPFHKGHLNILEKAELLFDKVIVAFGSNPSKEYPGRDQYIESFRLSEKMRWRQVEKFDCLLSDYVKLKEDDYTSVVVVKGVGRPGDLEDEKIQQRYLEDLHASIKIVYIIPDRKYDHYASKGVRALAAFDKTVSSNYTI